MVVSTKLFAPPTRIDLVPRTDLVRRLERGASDHDLCVLCAPAGFGKTTTVVHWLHHSDRPHAWLSLDALDNDPERFWTHVAAAVQSLWPELHIRVRSGGGLRDIDALINAVVEQMGGASAPGDASPRRVLVLDDYHLITSPDLHTSVDYLLDHLPPPLVVVLASRTDPPLSLPRRRAGGTLTELRAADLRFARSESATFLNEVMHLGLSPAEIDTLDARTEGWPASLHLAALSLRRTGARDRFLQSFSGSDRHLVDYLAEEVLEHQPDDVIAFLLATSVPDRFCVGLCETLLGTGDPAGYASGRMAADLLAQVEQEGLFLIPLDRDRRWFRYHHLFADLLRARLERNAPNRLRTLHRRAAEWFDAQDLVDEAIGHALAAGDHTWAAALIEKKGMSVITQLGRPVPERWIQALPDDVRKKRPMVAIVHAWSLLIQQPMLFPNPQDMNRVRECLHEAEAAIRSGGVTEKERTIVRRHVDMARAHLARFEGNVEEAVARSTAQLKALPVEPGLFRSATSFNLGLAQIVAQQTDAAIETFRRAEPMTPADAHYVRVGMAYMRALIALCRGNLYEAHDIYRSTLDAAPTPFPSYAGSHLVGLGRVLFLWNRLEEAYTALMDGLSHVRRAGDPLIEANGRACLVRVTAAMGDPERARAEVDRLRREIPVAKPLTRALYLELGEHRGAMGRTVDDWLAAGDADFPHVTARGEWRFAEWLAEGRLWAERPARKHGPNAAALSDVTGALTRHADAADVWTLREVRTRIVLACALHAGGNADGAADALAHALSAAAEGNLVRPFLDAGAPVMQLLRQRRRQNATAATDDFLIRLLSTDEIADHGTNKRPPHADLPESLTPRELDVLIHIAQGQTNREVADELFISYETVKTHAQNIYGKLNVRNRVQAVEKAHEWGMLPGDS